MAERTKLREAREAKGLHEGKQLSQQDIAAAIGCSREAYSLWERGQSDPQGHWVEKLCTFFDVTNPKDLDIEKATAPRRQVLQMIVGAGAAGVLMSFGHTSLSAEEFLIQCHASINGCWHLIKNNNSTTAEGILQAYTPTLSSLTMHPSHIQKESASLATQVKFLQIIFASRKLDYLSRELLCLEAVRLAKLSGDKHLLATALEWYGDTYTTCYHQPGKAIAIFKDGIKHLNSDIPLNKSALFSNIALAYAQDGNEEFARNYIEQARAVIPKHPELDPLYQCIDFGLSELNGREGKMYLDLAEHFPNSNYAQIAYDAFDASIRKNPTSQTHLSQQLIRKAEAAHALGEMRHYLDCLEQAIVIALHMDSEKQKRSSIMALNKAPDHWKKEQKYQDLVKTL